MRRDRVDGFGGAVAVARPALTAAMAFSGGRTEPAPMTPARFDAWYAEFRGPLRAYLRRVTRGAGAADDLFQETWIRFLAHPPRTDDVATVRAYVFTIASRLATDAWRRESWLARWIHSPRHGADVDGHDDDAIEAVPERSPGVDARHEAKEEASRALSALPPRERAILWLAHVERYEHREIAKMLNLRPASIRVLLHRARKRALARLENSRGERGDRT
jgi:RNA polymerase sigma-70 factor (ECF subfamily)